MVYEKSFVAAYSQEWDLIAICSFVKFAGMNNNVAEFSGETLIEAPIRHVEIYTSEKVKGTLFECIFKETLTQATPAFLGGNVTFSHPLW